MSVQSMPYAFLMRKFGALCWDLALNLTDKSYLVCCGGVLVGNFGVTSKHWNLFHSTPKPIFEIQVTEHPAPPRKKGWTKTLQVMRRKINASHQKQYFYGTVRNTRFWSPRLLHCVRDNSRLKTFLMKFQIVLLCVVVLLISPLLRLTRS